MPDVTISITDAEGASLDEAIALESSLTRARIVLAATRFWILRWIQSPPDPNPDRAIKRTPGARDQVALAALQLSR